MQRAFKNSRSKHGASSIFLAIILSALILIECTFVTFVWDLDYALSVNTALKTQIDTILSDYNRQLFSVYGVYAFSIDGVDDECFNKALEINGLDSKSELYLSWKERLTTEDLKKAIDTYYWYRHDGITIKHTVDAYAELITQLDERGILDQIKQYMQSPAAEYVSKIMKGSETAEEWIEKAGDALNIDELIEEANELDNMSAEYKEAIKNFETDFDIDISDWDFLLEGISNMESFIDMEAEYLPEPASKWYIANYCAYNFDCHFRNDGDASINGTDFDSIHSHREGDCEYLITGDDSLSGVIAVQHMYLPILILGGVLTDYANEKIRNTIFLVAEVISGIIAAVSEGTVEIDPKIIAAGLTVLVAMYQSLGKTYTVLTGGRAVIFKYEDTDIVTYSYRDLLMIVFLFVPEEDLLDRCLEILERDYGKLYKGIGLEADFRGKTYSVEKSYQMYS